MFFIKGEGGEILLEGRAALSQREVDAFLKGAFRKKIRRRGEIGLFQKRLRTYGEAEFTWNFVPRVKQEDDHWATVHAWNDGTDTHLSIFGPQADEVVEKANRVEYRTLPGSAKQKKKTHRRRTKLARLEKKQRQRLEKLGRYAQPASTTQKQRRAFMPAPISLVNNERLTPQFKKNLVFWKEALTAIDKIFDVRSTGKNSGKQRVARELFSSLERSGYRFAQYKRCGFTIRVDLIDGIWRGDITPLKISCTKDNTHPTYRRMRSYFDMMLVGQPDKVHAMRRNRIATVLQLVA